MSDNRIQLNTRLFNATLLLTIVTLTGWMLYVGRAILIPLVIAAVLWFVIDTMAHVFQHGWGLFRLSRAWAMLLALLIVALCCVMTFNLVAANVALLSQDAALYQVRIEAKLNQLAHVISPGMKISLDGFDNLFNLQKLVRWAANLVRGFFGMAILVFIYIIFLAAEQQNLPAKLLALFPEKDRQQHAQEILQRINQNIRAYLGIKTLVSLLTGLLTYLVLIGFGVDFPAFWGFLVFLLNYIPNLGSMLGVMFPALLALVQFETYWPFVWISLSLTSIQFIIGNLVEPRLMGNRLNLSGLVIILSLAVWGSLWGITGMILSVPIMVILMIILSMYEQTRPLAILMSSNGKL
ncbi:MAG: AI-2E family transporter [Thiolinea sp.]